MIYRNRPYEIFLILILILIAIFFPLASILLFFLWMSDKNKFFGKIYILLFLISLVVVNSSKHFDGDLIWYYDHYQWIYYNGLSNYFGRLITGVYAKASEPIMYWLFYFSGFLIGDNRWAFLILFTLIPYIILISCINSFLYTFNVGRKFIYTGIILVLSLGLTFTLSMHLMRQFLAESIILLSLAYFFKGKKILPFFLLLLAFLTHNSTIYIMVIMLLSYISFKFKNKNQTLIVFLVSLISSISTYLISKILTTDNQDYIYKNDGSISILVYVMDVFLFLFNLYFLKFVKLNGGRFYYFYNYILCLFVINFFTLFGFINVPLLFLRFGFFSEIIRVLMLCTIMKIISMKFSYHFSLGILILVISLLYLHFRIVSSGFTFDINLIDIFLIKFSDI